MNHSENGQKSGRRVSDVVVSNIPTALHTRALCPLMTAFIISPFMKSFIAMNSGFRKPH